MHYPQLDLCVLALARKVAVPAIVWQQLKVEKRQDKSLTDKRASAMHKPILCIVYQHVIHTDTCPWKSLHQSTH